MSFWTDERDDELRRLLDGEEGSLSFSEIAARMGCSRNAAIGRAHRLGIKRMSYAPKPDRSVRPPRPEKPPRVVQRKPPRSNISPLTNYPTARKKTKPTKEALRMVVDPGQPLPESIMVELWQAKEGHCRFPYGDPADVESFRFCGAPKDGESSYCWRHRAMCTTAYVRPPVAGNFRSVMTAKTALAVSCDREEAA